MHATKQPLQSALPSIGRSRFAYAPRKLSRQIELGQFAALSAAFATTGGIVDGDTFARRMQAKHWEQPISTLARWMATREAVSVTWQGQLLVPVFQFDPARLWLRQSVVRVTKELGDTFDDWQLAVWFAEPNTWLQDFAPADLIGTDDEAVYEAARADRFIARG